MEPTDLDLGHYERFVKILHNNLTRNNNFTTGRIYADVILKARGLLRRDYTSYPHITDEIKLRIVEARKADDA